MLLNHWFYNISENSVAKPIGFTTFKKLLKHLAVDFFKINVAKTNGFNNIVFENVVKPMIFASQHCFCKCCNSNITFEHVVKPMV